jgi:predicted membrane-bound spermidine synthase
LLLLYTATLFLSAFLLFWVQLFVAKLLLPLLGGSPSVWNTCMCFFQTVLLLGYGYAHLVTQWLAPQRQKRLHGLLLLLPLPFLPIALRPEVVQQWGVSMESHPIPGVLLTLALAVGLPFFVVSTSAPLLQQWFSQTQHPHSQDPYFLYAASNCGSLLGLLCYPLVLEPRLTLSQQGQLWGIGYGVFLGLGLACAFWRTPVIFQKPVVSPTSATSPKPAPALSWQQQGRWVLFAFIPTSLLLGVTTYITTDIAAIPLLWAVPLAIYLLTFILAFARTPLVPENFSNKLLPLLPPLATALLLLLLLKVTHPTLLILLLHLLGLGVFALAFHGELARTRPDATALTRFYFCISLGGVLAGWFNAILAPLVFTTLLEYPLLLLLCLLLLTSLNPQPFAQSPLRLSLPLSLGLTVGGLGMGWSGQTAYLVATVAAVGLWLLIAKLLDAKKLRIVFGSLLVLLLSQFSINSLGGILTSQRSFFGVYQILQDPVGQYNTLLHGTTVHGRQNYRTERRRDPLTYFTATGPIGDVFTVWQRQFTQKSEAKPAQVAVLGLGVGTLAAYAQPQEDWTFYEIDPLVTQFAQNPAYFSFLADSPASSRVIAGDARQQIKAAPTAAYDLIVMDAFSSDAIPVHLVTQEALQLYLQKLTPHGWIVINITNRHLDLTPVLAGLAENLGLTALTQYDQQVTDAEKAAGKAASRWVVLARQSQDLGTLANSPQWQPLVAKADFPLWTDDFSNLWQIWRRD